MGVHDGHRERMRQRFFRSGLDSFNEIEALEMLLFYAVPRRDTNVLAHELLARFGSLDEVFAATEQELSEVPGVGSTAAALIMLVPQLTRLSEVKRAERRTSVNTLRDVVDYLLPRFRYERDECVIVLCLNGQRQIVHTELMARGAVDAVPFDVRRIVEVALKRKAVYVVLAHNHPAGPADPSEEDDAATLQISRALSAVNITLFDHIITAGDSYMSYRESGRADLL